MADPNDPHDDRYYLEQAYGHAEILIVTESPKDLLDRLSVDAAIAGPTALTEEQRDLLKWARRKYEEWRKAQVPQPARIAPHKPKPAASPPPPAQRPYNGQDTPASLGSPDVAATLKVSTGPPPLALTPESANQAVWGQNNPVSPQEAAQRLQPPPPTLEGLRSAEDNLRRNEPQDGESHPSHADPTPRRRAKDGDPVDLATGDFTLAGVDIEVPSPHLPIRFVRQYRSGRPYFGPFGFGWDHGYNVYLRPLNGGDMALWTGELSEVRLRPAGPRWHAEGLAAVLERATQPGEVWLLRQRGAQVWRFEYPPGWPNARRIPLTRIEDRHGNRLALSYDGQGRLSSVLDEAGRGLRMGYGSCGLLETVSDHSGGRTVRYQHHPEVEHLVRVAWPPTAEFAQGPSASYIYESPGAPPAMQHNIVRVIDAYGQTSVENEYAGPEAGWAFNRVVRQQSGPYEHRFAYEQIQYVWPDPLNVEIPASRTAVATPDRALHVYTFNYRGDLVDHRFRLNADGSLRVAATQRRYDAEGNLVEEIQPDGGRTLWRYDTANPDPRARRNLLQVERVASLPFLQPSRIISRTQYDPQFQLPVREHDEHNRETRLVYDFDVGAPNPSGRLVRHERPMTTLVDGSQQQSVSHFEHNARGQLTTMVTPNGVRCELDYYASGGDVGRLRRITEDVGDVSAVTTLAYNASGFLATLTRPGGVTTETIRNQQGQIEEIIPPGGAGQDSVRQWLNDAGKVVRVERPRGDYADPVIADPFILDVFAYDVQGRLVRAELAANTAQPRVRRFRLDHAGRPLSEWDGLGARTERRYDERGLLLREIQAFGTPEAATRHYRYDQAGRPASFTDATGRRTTFQTDVWGRERVRVHPNGAAEIFTWREGDLLLERKVEGAANAGDPPALLAWESRDYDEAGRLCRRTQWSFVDDPTAAAPVTQQLLYDADDNVVALISPRMARTEFSYDGLGRRTGSVDPLGNAVALKYGPTGMLEWVTLSDVEGGTYRNRTFHYLYDDRLRLRATEAPDGRTELEYDARDVVVERREPGGVVRRFQVSPHGEVEYSVLDPGGLSIQNAWRFDAAGRLTDYKNPVGEVTTWRRDALGRPVALTLPDGSTTTRRFDGEGRVLEQRQPSGASVTFGYGPGQHPVSMSGTASPGVASVPAHTFAYDGLDRLVSAENTSGQVTRRYDSLGRLREETAQGGLLAFGHDDQAGTSDLRFPDGRVERTRHDALGRPSEVTVHDSGALGGWPGDGLIYLSYAGPGRPWSYDYPNGVSTELAYDDAARLIRVQVSRSGVELDSFRTRYDARGRRAVTQVTGAPARPALHAFDNRDRLIAARQGFVLAPLADEPDPAVQAAAIPASPGVPPRTETYLLDEADTRHKLTRRTPAATTDFPFTVSTGGQVTAVGGQPLTYHADGPRQSDSTLRYEIDALGRTVRILDAAGGVRLDIEYDALSRPASGTEDGQPFRRWFVEGRWVHEERGATALVRQASPHPLDPLPFCVRDANGQTFIHADGGLSSLCVTDAAGQLVQRHRYGAFGQPELFDPAGGALPLSAAVAPAWRGMSLRPGLQLFESQSRLYDPAIGAFLARDPVLFVDSPSPYAFAAHNPVDFADPTGRNRKALGEKSWIQTPEETDWDKFKKKVMLDEPPNGLWMLAGDPGALVYGMLYGIKHDIYEPIKAQVLDERPKYLDAHQNVQTVPWKPDRSPQLAVAWGNIAIIPLSSEKLMFQTSLAQQLETRGGEIWSHLSIHEGYGPYRGAYKSSVALTRVTVEGEELTIVTTNDQKAWEMLHAAVEEGRLKLEPGERIGRNFYRTKGGGMHSELQGFFNAQEMGASEGSVWTHPDCCWACDAWMDANAPGWTHLNPPRPWRLERAARQWGMR